MRDLIEQVVVVIGILVFLAGSLGLLSILINIMEVM